MDLMDLVSERVRIIQEGTWTKKQVRTRVSAKYAHAITEEIKKVADERFAARKTKNPKLFDGPTLHLNIKHSVIQSDRIFLALSKTTYSIYDIARKEYAEKYGWEDLPIGMGVNAVILTSDSKIVITDRSGFELDHSAKISVAVGGVYSGGHPFSHITEELFEELAIKQKEIKKLILIGISNRLDERQNHELTFLIETPLSEVRVIEKEKKAKEKEGRIFFLNQNSVELHEYLKENHRRILSTGFSALVIAGRYWWGPNWSKIS